MIAGNCMIDEFRLELTCGACPEQYDVYLGGAQVGYLRLRHGYFYAAYPDTGGKIIYEANPEGDGLFEYEERERYLRAACAAIRRAINGSTAPELIDPSEHFFRLCGPALKDEIERALRLRGVEAYVSRDERGPDGWSIYAVPHSELRKLPSDAAGPYLGDENIGYSMHPMPDANEFRQQARYGDWERV